MKLPFRFLRVCAAALLLLPASIVPLRAQVKESTIQKEMGKLRSLSLTDRPPATIKLAQEIASLPAGKNKVQDADNLSHLVTEGDQGADALQAVADTLAKALAETPIPGKGSEPPMPYMDLARLVRYEGVTATLNDPLYAKANDVLAADDADIAKADFSLKDMHNKTVTLSQLRGKIVMVNFWATWCVPCRREMSDLDSLQTRFDSQGLVVLGITDENPFTVGSFLGGNPYHPTILFDPDSKVHKEFHIEGIPRTYVFDRDGKLIGETIDQGTWKQFITILAKTDLHP
jgi:thiol-disulfide isomerase/thioredoxin